MATNGSASQPRSAGGKIVRPRRPARPRTPYDMPFSSPPPARLLPGSDDENPNWLSRLVLSPTRLIATGAGKVLASVFGPDPPPSSSSSEDDDDSSSDGDMDDENDASAQSSDGIEKNNQTLQMINSLGKEPKEVEWKTETKRVIARLLTQETFSREECDKLTHIISSRVIDSPISRGTAEEDVAMPDLRSAAVIEAKKWLEEKKLGSNSKSELDYGTCSLNTAMLSHDHDGEVGSPVDVAKSYMQERPPWSSPSISGIELKSLSPIGTQLYKEWTPYFFSGNSVSPYKPSGDSPATGSWNIIQELRKVRSKATEEMLRTPSSRINWSAVVLGNKRSHVSLVVDKAVSGLEYEIHTSAQLTDAPLNLVCGVAANGLAVSQITKDGLQNDAVPPDSATSIPGPSQDQVASPINEGGRGISSHIQRLQVLADANAALQNDDDAAGVTSQALGSMMGETIQDSRSHDINCLLSKEVAERDGATTANGFRTSRSSLSAGLEPERERNSRSSDEENNLLKSGHDRTSAPVDETCDLLGEASIEVPIPDEDGIVAAASRSQNNSSMQLDELIQDLTRPNLKRKTSGKKTSGVAEKQQRTKPSRNSRRGQSRGK